MLNTTNIQIAWANPLLPGETIDVDWEVLDPQQTQPQATVRILNATTLRVEWEGGVLATGETIVVVADVVDMSQFSIASLSDRIDEILYRQLRTLAYLGENVLQDDIQYDDPGTMVSYRIRVFDTKAHLQAATIDIADGSPLETGELSRCRVTQEIDVGSNDRTSLAKVLDQVATP